MKVKNQFLYVICLIIMCVMLAGCGNSEHKRNNKYTYGILENNNIEAVYELVGSKKEYSLHQFQNSSSNYAGMIYTSETADGGVVAWGNNIYVYSPDREDERYVHNEAISESLANKD